MPSGAASSLEFATSLLTIGSHVLSMRLARSVLQSLGHDRATAPDSPIVVWRQQLGVRHREVTEAEHAAIVAAKRTASVSELCALLTHDGAGDANAVFRTLSTWFARGWVTSLREGKAWRRA